MKSISIRLRQSKAAAGIILPPRFNRPSSHGKKEDAVSQKAASSQSGNESENDDGSSTSTPKPAPTQRRGRRGSVGAGSYDMLDPAPRTEIMNEEDEFETTNGALQDAQDFERLRNKMMVSRQKLLNNIYYIDNSPDYKNENKLNFILRNFMCVTGGGSGS